jgi:hypothetical protein
VVVVVVVVAIKSLLLVLLNPREIEKELGAGID